MSPVINPSLKPDFPGSAKPRGAAETLLPHLPSNTYAHADGTFKHYLEWTTPTAKWKLQLTFMEVVSEPHGKGRVKVNIYAPGAQVEFNDFEPARILAVLLALGAEIPQGFIEF